MPLDKWGINYIYASKVGGFNYEMEDDPENSNYVDWPAEVSFNGDGTFEMQPNGPTDFGVGKNISSFTDAIGGCNMDFADTVSRGYMFRADDPRDLEIKAIMQFDGIESGNDLSISTRSGHHTSDNCCQGFAYMFGYDCNTNEFRFRKEMWHVSYHESPEGSFSDSRVTDDYNGGKKIGLGLVIYNKPGTTDRVVLEGWCNPDPTANIKNWVMVKRIEDFPGNGWGDDGGDCGGDDDQVGTWSGPQSRMKTNSTSGSIVFEKLSLREIDPTRALDDVTSPPPGGGDPEPPPTTGGGSTPPITISPIITYGAILALSTDPGTSPVVSPLQRIVLRTAIQLANSMIDPDPFARFGPAGWRRAGNSTTTSTTGSGSLAISTWDVGGLPCTKAVDVQFYADGLGAQSYWSNSADACIIPGLTNGTVTGGTDVTNYGGRIMKNPKIHLIFWGSDWNTRTDTPTKQQIIDEVRDKLLGTDRQYFDGIQQYGSPGYPVWGSTGSSQPGTTTPPPLTTGEIDSNGIKWLYAHGTIVEQEQTRDDPGDHRWSHDTEGAGKGYEVTWIMSPTGVTPGSGSSAGHSALKFGGPNHSGDCGGHPEQMEGGECCCWYDLGIRANGDLQFQIERPHPDNSDFDPGTQLFDNVGHEMEDHDTGVKIVAYPHITGGTAENGGIHIKFYINSDALTSGTPNNNWRLAAEFLDTGQILGDGYEWPDYQELEVRNSDTDNSNFYNDSLYIRMLTDADLAGLRSGSSGGGTTTPPPTTTPAGAGAVTNTRYPVPSNNEWVVSDAEKVIKNTLENGQLPARNVDFLNELYIVIGPVDATLRDDKAPLVVTPPNTTGVYDINITLNTVGDTYGGNLTARQVFDLVAAEEMIEVQTDPFGEAWDGPNIDANSEDFSRQIGDTPCDFDPEPPGIDFYADGFCVEAYWSNRHNDCVIPGITTDTGQSAADLTYHGGRVMKNPKIILIFWGQRWETRTSTPTKTQLIQDVRDKLLGTDTIYFSELNQYSGCGIPVWGGAYQNNNIDLSNDTGEIIDDTFNGDWSGAYDVVIDCLERGIIPLTGLDIENTEFIVIPEYGRLNSDYLGVHAINDIGIDIPTPPPPVGGSPYPEVSARHDCFKPTLLIPGTGGGTLPTEPPAGASTIQPQISWATIQVVDPAQSIIHSQLPDWNGNNTITRPLAKALINSQTNTDPWERFGLSGWSGSSLGIDIGDSPCQFSDTLDNVHIYGDGLGVEAYWSNLAANCMVPGRGDPDLGTSTRMTFKGGRIMKTPLVVLIFWGPAWLTRVDIPTVASITTEVKEKLLDNDNEYFSQIGQYSGCGVPQFGASVINTNVQVPSDHAITTVMAMAVIKSTLQSGVLPTALFDFANTWFCVIPEYTSQLYHPVNTTTGIGFWYDVFQPTIIVPGGVDTGEGGGTDPTELQTVTGTLSFKRDINMVRVTTCAGSDVIQPPPPPDEPPPDPPSGGTTIFYRVTSTSNQKEISNESSSDDRTRIMEVIDTSSSAMKGKILKQADCYLKKESGTTDVTPLVYFKIWNASNTVVYTSPTTFTPNELGTSFSLKVFDCSTNTHVFVVGDKCGVEFTGTDPDQFIWTAYATSDSGNTGSSGSFSEYKEGSSYDQQEGRRMSITLWE